MQNPPSLFGGSDLRISGSPLVPFDDDNESLSSIGNDDPMYKAWGESENTQYPTDEVSFPEISDSPLVSEDDSRSSTVDSSSAEDLAMTARDWAVKLCQLIKSTKSVRDPKNKRDFKKRDLKKYWPIPKRLPVWIKNQLNEIVSTLSSPQDELETLLSRGFKREFTKAMNSGRVLPDKGKHLKKYLIRRLKKRIKSEASPSLKSESDNTTENLLMKLRSRNFQNRKKIAQPENENRSSEQFPAIAGSSPRSEKSYAGDANTPSPPQEPADAASVDPTDEDLTYWTNIWGNIDQTKSVLDKNRKLLKMIREGDWVELNTKITGFNDEFDFSRSREIGHRGQVIDLDEDEILIRWPFDGEQTWIPKSQVNMV